MPNYILKNVVWMDDNINDILHIEDGWQYKWYITYWIIETFNTPMIMN